MKKGMSSRSGASEGTRLCAGFRLVRGAVEFELRREGWVRVVRPELVDYCDLRSFLAAMHTKGGT